MKINGLLWQFCSPAGPVVGLIRSDYGPVIGSNSRQQALSASVSDRARPLTNGRQRDCQRGRSSARRIAPSFGRGGARDAPALVGAGHRGARGVHE